MTEPAFSWLGGPAEAYCNDEYCPCRPATYGDDMDPNPDGREYIVIEPEEVPS